MMVRARGAGVTSSDFGAHTYWRVKAMSTISGAMSFSAMRFRDASGNEIAATGGTALESGHTGSNVIANLFDGNDATYWESDAASRNTYCGYQFATPVTVMQIALQRHNGMSSSPPVNVRFEFSDDGVVWKDAAYVEVGTFVTDTPKWFDMASVVVPAGATTFGSHAYWRVFNPRTVTDAVSSISAILFKDGSGSAIAATGGTAIGTGSDPTHAVANAFDGSDSTWWNSAALSSTAFAFQWIGYQFATPKTVMQMAVQRHTGMDGILPNHVAFQFSDDGVMWGTACWANPNPSMASDTPAWFNFANGFPVANGTDFGAHKFWKVQTVLGGYTGTQEAGLSALAEILFKDASGSAISRTGETPHASSGTAANAFDNNVGTVWESANDHDLPWISLEFAIAQTVMQMGLERSSSQSVVLEPREVQFMWSDNGTEYVNVCFAVTAPMVNNTVKYFDFAQVI